MLFFPHFSIKETENLILIFISPNEHQKLYFHEFGEIKIDLTPKK